MTPAERNVMKTRRGSAEAAATVLMLAMALFLVSCVCYGFYDRGYESGQTDALSGRAVWYRLEKRSDGERRWILQDKPTTRPFTEEAP